MRVRILSLCVVCLAAFNFHPYTYIINEATQVNVSEHKDSLQLTTSITKQKYCTGDAELDSLRLVLRLNFTNIGQQNLILYKGSNLVSKLMISQNLKDLSDRRFEVYASLTQVAEESNEKVGGPVPNKSFIILPSGATYKTEAIISIFAVRGNASGITGAVAAGEHFLQLEVPTWPASNELAKKSRSLWQRSGCLWYEPTISVPMAFKVEKERAVVDCS